MITPIRIFKITPGSPLSISSQSPRENWSSTAKMSRFLSMKSPRCKPPRRLALRAYLFTDPRRWQGVRIARRGKGNSENTPGLSKNTKSDGPHFLRYPRVVHTTWEFLDDVREFRLHISHSPTGSTRSSLSPSGIRARARSSCHLFFWGPQPSVQSICVRKLIGGRKGRREAHLHRDTIMSILSLSTRTRGVQSRNRDACPWHAAETIKSPRTTGHDNVKRR